MTMLDQTMPEVVPELAFTAQEIYLLDQLVSDTAKTAATGNTLSLYLTRLARFARLSGSRPKIHRQETVIWRRLTRLRFRSYPANNHALSEILKPVRLGSPKNVF
jgi:hypothetical protein